MANINVNEAKINILESQPLKDGRCKLVMSFFYKGKRLRLDTGERVLPEHFDKARQRVNRKQPFHVEINMILDRFCTEVVLAYKKSIAKGVLPSTKELREIVKPKAKDEIEKNSHSMADYFDLFERHLISQRRSRSTKYKYRTLQRMFSRYEKQKKIKIRLDSFDEIDHAKFTNWCIYELDNVPSTVSKRNGFIKAFFSFCERNGATVHPFYKAIKIRKVDTEMIFLTEKELNKIEEAQVDSYLEKTKDCFLFSCYTGLRYSDIEKLTLDHIHLIEDNYILEIIQEKTDKKVSVALSDKAVEIMNKYKNNVIMSQRNKYFLPIITNQKLNLYLKELGRLAEIDIPVEKLVYQKGEATKVIVPKYELLTFHKARHTFATLSLQRGMPITVLQKILGHRRLEETMIYAKVVESFQHDQLLKAWNTEEKQEEKEEIVIEKTKETVIQNNDQFERLKSDIKSAVEVQKTELHVFEELQSSTLGKLEKMGFKIKNTTPIQKLENLYHIISW
ncbi:site-specific integrase [Bernardetia sp. Wsw4-3y2]|uniref:site-specific integrase n=1 Tax=Bernardetia sp. Wsw4-3y2 TaxID=3127471 RepID=UPI0030CEBFDB